VKVTHTVYNGVVRFERAHLLVQLGAQVVKVDVTVDRAGAQVVAVLVQVKRGYSVRAVDFIQRPVDYK
jgi:hypothetical protein